MTGLVKNGMEQRIPALALSFGFAGERNRLIFADVRRGDDFKGRAALQVLDYEGAQCSL